MLDWLEERYHIMATKSIDSERRSESITSRQGPSGTLKKSTAALAVLPSVLAGAEDEIRTRDPVLGKDVLYH